jgi:putative aminophosphonate oxidoreductase
VSTQPSHRSLWLSEAGCNDQGVEFLTGSDAVDVAIVGGGYVGLWTAIRIKEWDPGCEVAVVEQDVCGGGASGRNGGFVLSWWPKLPSLVKLWGSDQALAIGRASENAIEEIRVFCDAHGIDAHFRRGGWLWTATNQAQLGSWEQTVSLCERLGVEAFRRIEPSEVARRSGSSAHIAGVLESSGATIQPALLARGLRRVALERGVRIFEQSKVREIHRAYPPVVCTDRGEIRAEKVVIATNAWAAGLRELRRALIVVSSDIVATPPIADRLTEIGWSDGECITDSQLMICYYRTTNDGRIVFGKGGWGIAYSGRIGRHFDHNARRAAAVTADFRALYPMLRDVPIEHDWSGPIDRSATGLPILGRLGGRDHLLYGVGWSGNGVAPSVIGGRILASLALGLDNEWSRSPLVDQPYALLPPEPIRFAGAHIIRAAVRWKEQAEAHGRRPNRVAAALSGLVPAGLEDK